MTAAHLSLGHLIGASAYTIYALNKVRTVGVVPQTMDWSRSSHGIGQSLPEQIRVVHPLTTSIFIECGPRVRHGTHTYRRDQLAQAVRECGNSCATVGSGSPSFLLVSQTTSVAETLQSDSQEPPQLTEKQQIAHSIKPEQVKKGWLGSTKSKPGLMELREELQRRWHSDEPEWTFPICGQSRR